MLSLYITKCPLCWSWSSIRTCRELKMPLLTITAKDSMDTVLKLSLEGEKSSIQFHIETGYLHSIISSTLSTPSVIFSVVGPLLNFSVASMLLWLHVGDWSILFSEHWKMVANGNILWQLCLNSINNNELSPKDPFSIVSYAIIQFCKGMEYVLNYTSRDFIREHFHVKSNSKQTLSENFKANVWTIT